MSDVKENIKRVEEFYWKGIATIRKKNHDYAGDDFFKNFKMTESLGIVGTEQWFLVRMCDKLSRLATLIGEKREAKVSDESVEDTLLDLANYSWLLYAYIKAKADKEKTCGKSLWEVSFERSHISDWGGGWPWEFTDIELIETRAATGKLSKSQRL